MTFDWHHQAKLDGGTIAFSLSDAFLKDLPGVLTSCTSIRVPHTFGKLSRSAARPSPIKTYYDGNHETEFDESLWAGLVDSMTVHGKDRIMFRLTCGMEMEA